MKGPKKQPKRSELLKTYGWREFIKGGYIQDGPIDHELIKKFTPKLSRRQIQKIINRREQFERKLQQIRENSQP